MPKITDRFRDGWNAFMGNLQFYRPFSGNSRRPDRVSLSLTNARSIVTSVYNRIAVDVSALDIRHVRLDSEGNYKETITSDLNDTLSVEANIDQTGRAMIQDAVMSMFDEGVVAIAPIWTDTDPTGINSYRIYSLRVCKIVEWFPTAVRMEAYDERDGRKRELVMDKAMVAIIENPFYAIMNEPNSTLQRLIRTLNQLDRINNESSTGKMDIIIQLPYMIKSKARQIQAEQRRKALEEQMNGSQYGIGYIDGTERVIQLNRAVENNLWNQAKELTAELYNQLGLTQSIFDGTADEQTLLNYYDRSVGPIITAITEEMTRKWLTKTARTQGQCIRFFRDPFKLMPISQLIEMSDKVTRNEIMSSNEVRAKLGLKPSKDPKADELRNSNLNHPDEGDNKSSNVEQETDDVSNIVNKYANTKLKR